MIMLIVLSHFEFLQRFDESGAVYNLFFKNAYLGVDFFFVMSGFGMMYSFIAKGESRDSLSIRGCLNYAVRHVRKIYKVYAITMLLCIPLYCFYEIKARGVPLDDLLWVEVKKMVVSIPLLQSAFGLKAYSHAFNSVTWFLSSLFCIYLISPLLLRWLRKIKSSKIAFTFLVIVFLCTVVTRICFECIQELSFFDDLVYGSPYCRVFYVVLGMLTAKIFLSNKERLTTLIGNKIEILVLISVLAFVLCKNTLANFHLFDITQAYISILLAIAVCFVFAFQNGSISRFLQWREIKHLGELAMYIFLIHYPIRGYLDALARYLNFGECQWVAIFNVIITLIMTFFISLFISERVTK